MGDGLFEFMGDPADPTFSGSGGMGDDMTIVSKSKERCPWLYCISSALGSAIWAVDDFQV